MKQIKMLFHRDGTVKVETTGYVGSSCQEASAPYERAIGAKVDDKPKPELFEAPLENGPITA